MKSSDIISAIQNNNHRQLTISLYKDAFPPILRFIKSKSGNREDAEDCFQEAVIGLIRKIQLGEFDGKESLTNYLFILSRNIWYNRVKREKRFVLSEEQELQREDLDTPENQLISEEKRQGFLALMQQSGEKCQELIKLISFEKKKMKEVMTLMNFNSEEVVRSTLYRCKKKLKEILTQNHELRSRLR